MRVLLISLIFVSFFVFILLLVINPSKAAVCESYCAEKGVYYLDCENCSTREGCRPSWIPCSDYLVCWSPKHEQVYRGGCSNAACYWVPDPPRFCGNSQDSDGGDSPRSSGRAIDRYCAPGCREDIYSDTCYGICSRDNLREYYVSSNDRVTSKDYTNLFSQKQYCKNGAIHDDMAIPRIELRPSGRGWENTDVRVDLLCNDNDESGCYRYKYDLRKVL